MLNVRSCFAVQKIECGGDLRLWKRIVKDLEQHFKHAGLTMHVYNHGKEQSLLKNLENYFLTDKHIAGILELSAQETVKNVILGCNGK